MIARYRAVAELVLAGAALAGAGLSWLHSHAAPWASRPSRTGSRHTASLVYDPQLLLLTLLLVTTAGVLAVSRTGQAAA